MGSQLKTWKRSIDQAIAMCCAHRTQPSEPRQTGHQPIKTIITWQRFFPCLCFPILCNVLIYLIIVKSTEWPGEGTTLLHAYSADNLASWSWALPVCRLSTPSHNIIAVKKSHSRQLVGDSMGVNGRGLRNIRQASLQSYPNKHPPQCPLNALFFLCTRCWNIMLTKTDLSP